MLPQIALIIHDPKTGHPTATAFLEANWAKTVEGLEERAEITKIESPEDIDSTLESSNPSAVVVLAGGWNKLDQKSIKTDTLKAYAEKGGKVIYTGVFAATADKFDIEAIFGKNGYDVGWFFNSYGPGVTARLNPEAWAITSDNLGPQSAQLPAEIGPFRPLILNVSNPRDVLYSVDTQVEPGEKLKAVGAVAQVGAGQVAVWGDRDDVDETVKVILAMAKL